MRVKGNAFFFYISKLCKRINLFINMAGLFITNIKITIKSVALAIFCKRKVNDKRITRSWNSVFYSYIDFAFSFTDAD